MQRRAVEVRDGGCASAGCGVPTWWCDVPHLLGWINGGVTDLATAALLCQRHHTEVHHGFRSSDDPTADGAPGDPTAPRSASDPDWTRQPDAAVRLLDGRAGQSRRPGSSGKGRPRGGTA